MPNKSELPEFEWGHIIQVPPVAICRHGVDPAYGRFYGVVVSSGLFWREQWRHEKEIQTELEERANKLNRNKDIDAKQHDSDDTEGTENSPEGTGKEDENATHRLLESAPAGQYLVALISKSKIYPGLDTRITSECRFKGSYIAAGLLVIVMEHQLKSIPRSDRCWGKLNETDEGHFRDRMKLLMQKGDWSKLRQIIAAESEPPGWFRRLVRRICSRFA